MTVETTELLPLIADAPWAALRPVWSGEEAAKKVRERASERSVKTMEVRGAERTDTFTIRVVGFELDDRAWQSLVRVAAKSPPKPAASSGIAIFDVAASGRVFGAGRKDATLADFDWLATEEALGDPHVVKVCEYSGGTTRAIASESIQVTVHQA